MFSIGFCGSMFSGLQIMESTCDNRELQSELMHDFQESGIEQITSMDLTKYARLVASV